MNKLAEVISVVVFAGAMAVSGLSGYAKVDGKLVNLNSYESKMGVVHERVFADKALDNEFVTYDFTCQQACVYRKLTGVSLSYAPVIDYDGLHRYVKEWNASHAKQANAKITKDLKLRREKSGQQINWKNLKRALQSGQTSITLEDYYIQPTVTKTDLLKAYKRLKAMQAWVVTYDNGTEVRYDGGRLAYKNGKIYADTEWISQVFSDLELHLNTVGDATKFRTHSGEVIKIEGGTWGRLVDETAEVNALVELFLKGESQTKRTPILSFDTGRLGDTYLEVSLSQQHMWEWRDGKVVSESDVVTGTKGKHDTPTGVYYIMERISGKWLTGDDYRTWVDRWMRLTNYGVGLHDASWRGRFGGNVYAYSGSHGCINLPKGYAYALFDRCERGEAVVVY